MTGGATRPRRGPIDDASFTRNMRYELADAEGRAIVWSWAVAVSLGLLWILLVIFLPAVPPSISLLRPEETAPVQVQFEDLTPPTPEPAGAPAAPAAKPAPRPAGGGRRGAAESDTRAIGDAFGGASSSAGGGGMVGDVSNVLRGVDVSSGAGATPGAGAGKAVIGYGKGGQGSRTPGRGGLGTGLGSTPGGGGLGGVGGGGGVGFSTVRVAPPSVIRAEKVGSAGRNVSDLGNYVRSRQSQLQFCYEEYGLKANPNLAGTIGVAVTLTGAGDVTGVDITKRSWSGAGATEAESCIRQRIRSWHFPPSSQGGGTYSFSFIFSK
ncbi:MAG TPA: AgmX/PglI C-terminal domain-containing protein [Gemmatimonadaceae bacterium]